ncbi:MAG: hypothetical protein IT233_12730 [Bacteroidia bacterium]|nr:hypothetical protein [Bacteroidia bacterium]
MNLPVEYIDSNGVTSNLNYTISRIAFLKHLGFAGQGSAPRLNRFIRTLGMFLTYSQYLQRQTFYNNHFSIPPPALYDPTEKGQFSTVAGRAIADFLSKRINNSLLTVNYEAAMRILRMPIKGKRPDLISFSPNSIFAIEAKGYSSNWHGVMAEHKAQSRSGKISVNFSMASVTYNMYDKIKCKYHDPYNDGVSYNEELLSSLSKQYYMGLYEFVNEKYFEIADLTIGVETFYEIGLTYRKLEKYFQRELPRRPFWIYEMVEFYRPRILITNRINAFLEEGLPRSMEVFIGLNNSQDVADKSSYIDNDGIGLTIG